MTNPPGVSRLIEHHELHTSTSDALRARLDDLDRLLSLRGIRIPGGSRFHSYRRLMAEPGATMSDLHRAFLESEQLCLIVFTLWQDRPPLALKQKLKTVLSGPLVPSDDHAASPARDHQFELFLAALSEAAGYQVDFVEPDLRLRGPGQPPFVVAAKRLKSRSKLRANVRKASKQIAGAQQQGIIALDITRLLQEPHKRLEAQDLAAASVAVSQLVDTFRDDHLRDIRAYCDLSWVVGVELVFTGLAQLREPPFLSMVWLARTANLCDHQDARCETLASYAKALAANPPVGPHMRQW